MTFHCLEMSWGIEIFLPTSLPTVLEFSSINNFTEQGKTTVKSTYIKFLVIVFSS